MEGTPFLLRLILFNSAPRLLAVNRYRHPAVEVSHRNLSFAGNATSPTPADSQEVAIAAARQNAQDPREIRAGLG